MTDPSKYLNSSSLMPLRKSKKKFTVYEDALLIKYVSIFGDNNWKLISKYFKNRNTRQLRERYTLYLKPGNLDTPWTNEEDNLLFQKIKEYGRHWSLIAKYFNGRNPNNIKNRWNFHLKCGTKLNKENENNSITQKNVDDNKIIDNFMKFTHKNDQSNTFFQNSNLKRHFYVVPIINQNKSSHEKENNETNEISSFINDTTASFMFDDDDDFDNSDDVFKQYFF